jgi:hypothetical protein
MVSLVQSASKCVRIVDEDVRYVRIEMASLVQSTSKCIQDFDFEVVLAGI